MPWRPLPRIAFAICTYPFHPSSPADLPLQIGDELYIIEQGGKDGAWYRGYLVAPPSLLAGLTSSKGQPLEARVFSGIFPGNCVEVRELLGEVTQGGRGVLESQPTEEYDQSEESSSGEESDANDEVRLAGDWPAPPKGMGQLTQSGSGTSEEGAAPGTHKNARSKPQSRRRATQDISAPSSKRLAAVRESSTLPEGGDGLGSSGKPPAPVPMLKIGDETATSRQEPLVDEIASCLREWHSTNLHELLLGRQYAALDEMSALVGRLDSTRRQLLHKILTDRELRDVRESAIWDLVRGNKILTGEVIVRSTSQKGRILTGHDSILDICALQANMSLLDKRPGQPPNSQALYHLMASVGNLGSGLDRSTTFVVALYGKDEDGVPRNLSENYAIDVTPEDAESSSELDRKARTLFADLTIPEESDASLEKHRVYLVMKVLADEPLREPQPANVSLWSAGENALGQLSSNMRNSSLKGGRRSFMFGPHNRAESEKGSKPAMQRPPTGSSLHSRTTLSRPPTSGDQKSLRRIIGAGIIDLGCPTVRATELEREMTIWAPSDRKGDPSESLDGVEKLVKFLLPSSTGKYLRFPNRDPLTLKLKSFVHPDCQALIKSTPTSLQHIHATRKIGFSGAPTRPRSDIYVNLSEPLLPLNANLSHPKLGAVPLPDDVGMANLQLTMEVRNADGERLENCIHPASNSAGHTAWRTGAIERGQAWNQTIRLAVRPEDVPGSHIIMSLADASSFPFALCWIPLWANDAFVRDGDHSLSLYRYDEETSSMIAGKGAYLSLPWNSKLKDESVTGPVAVLRVRTFLCSTRYSQDPNLLGLLRWRDQRSRGIMELLKKFPFVPEIEIVKLLDEVFDALFEIIVEYAGNDEIEDHVFHALVVVLGIVHDRRFNLQPLVDTYTAEKFNYPFAFPCLTKSLIRLLSDPTNPESARKLRAACKVGSHVFKFIINARQQQIKKEVGIGIQSNSPTFVKDLHGIFHALEQLMRDPSAILVGTKTLIVQNFHVWLPELIGVLTTDEIVSVAINFVESCSAVHGKLILYKLVLIRNVASSSLLSSVQAQRTWHEKTIQWINPHWGYSEVPSEDWRSQIRLCCSIVATHVTSLGMRSPQWLTKLVSSYVAIRKLGKQPNDSFSPLFPSTYPFPTKPTSSADHYDEALIEVAALFTSMFQSATNLPELSHADLSIHLQRTLDVFTSILDCEAFPKTWISAHIVFHSAILSGLQAIYNILSTQFLPPPDDADVFDTELWKSFFLTLLKLVGSDALSLETFPEQKRRAVWKIAGDVRELGAELLERSWFSIGWEASDEERELFDLRRIGGYQVQYVPTLVGPIVDSCSSIHDGLRAVAIMVLRTMIISEWALNQDLSAIQAEMIRSLDNLFKAERLNDGILQKLFLTELVTLFDTPYVGSDEPLLVAIKNVTGVIDQLLDHLIAVHNAASAGEAFQIMDTLRLMEFLKDVQKEDLYVEYMHKLADVQVKAQNPTEAGLAIKMHANLYDWNNSNTLPPISTPAFPQQSSFDRKERLYFIMVGHFEEGGSWHYALACYAELAHQYEYNVFDFAKLARAQRAMATIFEKISKGDRQDPRFFRVVFRGLGFPSSLRDKQYIFEGLPTDRLSTFSDRMQQQYPSAQITSGSSADDFEGQYLSVYPVGPQRDFYHPVNRRLNVAQPIRDHFMLARPQRFTTTSRRQASNTVTEQAQEKVVYTTADAFPNILRRSEIINTETVQLSPAQIGLERTIRKTHDLISLERHVAEEGDTALGALTNAIMVLVQDRQAGVADYWSLVHSSGTAEFETSKDRKHLNPVQEALRVALVDHVLTIRRCLEMYARSAHQATKAELLRNFERTFAAILPTANAATASAQDEGPTAHSLMKSTMANHRRNPLVNHTRKESDARAGTSEQPQTKPAFEKISNGAMVRGPHANGLTGAGVSQTSGATSSRGTTRDNDDEQAGTEHKSGTGKQAFQQAFQGRVGSVTKRLSAINIGKKPGRTNTKTPAVGSVTE